MDHLLTFLLEVILAPFHYWQKTRESSLVGESEFDRANQRSWKPWLIGLALLVIAICGGLIMILP